jgi:hypothetical protein
MRLNKVKRTVMATALAVATAVAGVAGQAQAFTFSQGDLVIAIYGNNQEALYDLGNASSLLAGATQDINLGTVGLAAASVGPNAVQYTVFGFNLNGGSGGVVASTIANLSAIIGPALNNQFNPTFNMSATGAFVGDTIGAADGKSFTSNLNAAGTGSMAGAWPVAMQGGIGQVLNILAGDVETNTFTQIGRVQFTSNGHLLIGNPGPAAVPLPAGVVLFGTGLIALVGIARRRINQMMA